MSKRRPKAFTGLIWAASLAIHGVIAALTVFSPEPERKAETIPIAFTEAPAPKAPEPAPPAPEPAPEPAPAPKPAPRAAPRPAPKAAPPAPAAAAEPPPAAASDSGAEGFADLGLTMGNGAGPGLAVPAGRPAQKPREERPKKVAALSPRPEDVCAEPLAKPRPRQIVKPAYTEEARQAQVEGAVRVEVTVDEAGGVKNVQVLRGLGYGLDEAAVEAIRRMTFNPGTRCGRPAIAQVTFNLRFALGS